MVRNTLSWKLSALAGNVSAPEIYASLRPELERYHPVITVWQGSANTWDCDEMGHMNVRVYVEKAMEGIGVLAHHIEMPHAFREKTPSTLIPVDQHIRFMREVRPGRPLHMDACVLEITEDEAVVFQGLYHGDGTPAAAVRTRIAHARAKSGTAFPWSARSRRALEELIDTPPKAMAPRSIDPDADILPAAAATRDAATAAGVPRIGVGAIPPHHCDPHGRLSTAWFMGRISDSVPNLLYDWRKRVASAANGARMGAAVLEYRLAYRRWPRAGDRFEIYSSLADAAEKTHTLVHWMVDPETGRAWLTSEALAVTFDLDTRKVIPTPPENIEELERIAPRGLQI
ncbi:MAG: thioesterase family protein [Pseudomonadota bacterium]